MGDNVDYVKLVRRARLGEKQCLESLAKAAQERLRVDVYRLTLQQDLTQDIVQESILEMLKNLHNLRQDDRFWPWLYKIALNKMRLHHRKEHNRRSVSLSAAGGVDGQDDGEQVTSSVIGRELKEIVFKAMQQLKPQHRAVLTMRCYREMEYSTIAEALGCSEFGARVLFSRAKKSLKRQLSRQGFGKGSLLMALTVFGKMTAPSEAAACQVSVAVSATKVGAVAGVIGMLAGKTAVVSLVTAGILAVGTVATISGPDEKKAASGGKTTEILGEAGRMGQAGRTVDECWYYFPESPDGPVMMRAMKSDARGKQSYCAWRQNEEANYHFDRGRNAIYIENARVWKKDLGVWRLPTDKAKLTRFLSQVEGRSEAMEYVSASGNGLFVISGRASEGNGNHSSMVHHQYILDGECFRYDWPAGVKVIDNRDEMHKRGWTYFVIAGHINGEEVLGSGRIPLVYAGSAEHSAWLRLKVGSRLTIADSGGDAIVFDGSGKVVGRYAGGSFFKGLGRPWMGLHTIDTVRRDAAEQQVRFETKYESKSGRAEVAMSGSEGKLTYTLDMEKDVINKIELSKTDGTEGELRFSYLEDIEQAGYEFVEPRIRRSYRAKRRGSPGMLWLLQIAFGEQ